MYFFELLSIFAITNGNADADADATEMHLFLIVFYSQNVPLECNVIAKIDFSFLAQVLSMLQITSIRGHRERETIAQVICIVGIACSRKNTRNYNFHVPIPIALTIVRVECGGIHAIVIISSLFC